MNIQGETEQPRFGRMILMGAAAVALAAIGYRVYQDRGQTAPTAHTDTGLAALAAKAATNPDDPAALQALGLVRYDAGDFAGAAAAYEKALVISPSNAFLWSALGEARVLASARDPMPAPALEAFRKAVSLDPKDPRARYFLAVKRDLDGDHKGALDDWLALLGDTPPGAPWEADLRRTIEQVGKIAKIDVAEPLAAAARKKAAAPPVMAGIPGPTAKDLQAATGLSPGEQRQMAEGMVASLEAKLKAAPANPEGWIMLIRSRKTLGQPEKAAQALKDGIAANPAQAAMLRQQAEVLGVR